MPHPYLLVYDGDCSLCLAWSRRLVRWAGLTDADRVSHLDLDPDLRARVEAAGLRNELKVVDRADGTITGGFEAIRRFGRGTGLASLVTLSGVPPFRWLWPLGYGLIARNRRVLARRRRAEWSARAIRTPTSATTSRSRSTRVPWRRSGGGW